VTLQTSSSTKLRVVPSRSLQNRSQAALSFLVGVESILGVKTIVGHSGAKLR
jgi:hypothetical protein